MTSVLAANFLVSELKLPLVGVVHSNAFPSTCRVHNGQVTSPPLSPLVSVVSSELRFLSPLYSEPMDSLTQLHVSLS